MTGCFARVNTLLYLLLITLSCRALVQGDNAPLIFDVTRSSTRATSDPSLSIQRRSEDLDSLDLTIESFTIFAKLTIGTPPQSLIFAIACNTADILVAASSVSNVSTTIEAHGVFTPDKSSSFQSLDQSYNGVGPFGGGQNLQVDYFLDTLAIGNTRVEQITIGLVNSFTTTAFVIANNSFVNVLGLGYAGGGNTTTNFPNLLFTLRNTSRIDCMAYSLWLDGPGSSNGQLILGGVDTAKFQGVLDPISISPQDPDAQTITIPLSGFGFTNGPQLIKEDTVLMTLGTTSDYIYLPTDVFNLIANQTGFTVDPTAFGPQRKACSEINNATSFDFTFGSTTLTVLLGDLVIYAYTANGTDYCHLYLFPGAKQGTYNADISLFKEMYLVVDLDQNEVSIAKINPNSTTSNVSLIPALGAAGISGAPLPGNDTNEPKSGLSAGAKAGIGIGAAVGVTLFAAAIGGILFMRRKRQKPDPPQAPDYKELAAAEKREMEATVERSRQELPAINSHGGGSVYEIGDARSEVGR